jgi:hypothetical protein
MNAVLDEPVVSANRPKGYDDTRRPTEKAEMARDVMSSGLGVPVALMYGIRVGSMMPRGSSLINT